MKVLPLRVVRSVDPFEFARVAHIWKIYDKQKLVELHSRCTLEGLASKIGCPLVETIEHATAVVHAALEFAWIPAKKTMRE